MVGNIFAHTGVFYLYKRNAEIGQGISAYSRAPVREKYAQEHEGIVKLRTFVGFK